MTARGIFSDRKRMKAFELDPGVSASMAKSPRRNPQTSVASMMDHYHPLGRVRDVAESAQGLRRTCETLLIAREVSQTRA